MPHRLLALTAALAALVACGAPGTAPAPPVVENPPEIPTCGFGAVPKTGLNPEGYEQWCQRAAAMHGPFERYALDGTRLILGEYAANEPHARWTWYHDNGEAKARGTYENGKPAGTWEWFHDNGVRAQMGDYTDNRKNGTWTSWWPNEQRASEGLYRNGDKEGTWKYWDELGRLRLTQTWKSGTLEDLVEHPLPGEEEDEEGSAG